MEREISAFGLIVPVLLLACSLAVSRAQNLVLSGIDRSVANQSYASGNGSQTSPYTILETNLAGVFDHSITQSCAVPLASAASHIIHHTIITTDRLGMQVSGTMEATSAASASHDDFSYGFCSTAPEGHVTVYFSLDQPYAYALTVQTVSSASGIDNPVSHGAVVSLYSTTTASNVALFGYDQNVNYTPAGSVGGVLPAGIYSLSATVLDQGTWNASPQNTYGDFSYTGERYVSFNLVVTLQPPGDLTFAPMGTGAFKIGWTAPYAGAYGVITSTNGVTWADYMPPTSWPLGHNELTITPPAGQNVGLFRIKYLPESD